MTTPLDPQDLRAMLTEATDLLDPVPVPLAQVQRRARARRTRAWAAAGGGLAAAAAAVVAIAVVAPGGSDQLRPATPTVAPYATGPGQVSPSAIPDEVTFSTRVAPAVAAMNEAGKTDPDFASVSLDYPHRALDVWRKGGQPDDRYRRVARTFHVPVLFHAAVLSARETSATEAAMLAARAEFTAAGVRLLGAASDGHGPVQVLVDRPTTQALAVAQRHAPYGPSTVTVEAGGPVAWDAHPACTAAALTLGFGDRVSAATGEHAVMFTLTNTSRSSCEMRGYPAVALFDAAGHALPFRYTRGHSQYVTSLAPQRVVLAPGGVSYFLVAKYRCDTGDRTAAATIQVYPPGARAALTGPAAPPNGGTPLAYCQGGASDPGQTTALSPAVETQEGATQPGR